MRADVSVLLAIGCPLLRGLLADRLRQESHLSVLGEVETSDQAVERVRRCGTDIVLMDIDLPGWFQASKLISSNHSPARFVFLEICARDRNIDHVLKHDNFGLVTCQDSISDILHALKEVIVGRQYISPKAQKRMAERQERYGSLMQASSRLDTLTARELDVLKCLALGMSKKEIAQSIHISINTVNRHASSLMEKLDIHDRVHLARFAIREQLVGWD
jgi:DNA-binding NarL/FixJ family response regulator